MKEQILNTIEKIGPELEALGRKLYENPELGYEEKIACAEHVALLKRHGFQAEENLDGMETAFRAVYDSGKAGLTVGFLAEYDALPEIGHGCGHNILGATSSGAAIALKEVIGQIGGKVILYGTPSEEFRGAKMAFAKDGIFDGLDIALMAHPSADYTKAPPMLALAPLEMEFIGKPSHAAASPAEGRSALEAMILTFVSVNSLRQVIRSDSRINGIMVKGGERTNIIPDYATCKFEVRSKTKTYNEELRERIRNCARGAALQTGTEVKFLESEVYLDNMVSNLTMEQVFCDLMEELFDIKVAPSPDLPGSNDAGLLSKICPMIHPMYGICQKEKYANHTVGFCDATVLPYAIENMKKSAVALAMTAVRVMTDSELYSRIRKEFEEVEK